MSASSYRDLEIYQLAKELAVAVHRMSIEVLPKFEMYEEGSQIRRSAKSIIANIVEGYGRRRHKHEFMQFLTYAVASCDETKCHLEILRETGSLPQSLFEELHGKYERLGAQLYKFRESVSIMHSVLREDDLLYHAS